MCFSQKASFGAAAVLAGIGAVALVKAKTPAQRAVALMPLIYATQQCAEGLLWISLTREEYRHLKRPLMYAFLFFAELVWPVYMPLIALLAEPDATRRQRIRPVLWLGLAMAAALIYGAVAYPTNTEVRAGHIWYDVQFPPANTWQYGALYFAATMAAPLLSSYRSFRVLGVMLLVTYIASRLFYNHYIISVWCYFAAILSIIALTMISEMKRGPVTQLILRNRPA